MLGGVSSTGRRNSSFKFSRGGDEAESLAGLAIELKGDAVELFLAVG
jgi:hypothetical protein